uniref:Transmembrane protein 170B n=1 Tax=Panagrellus redivivus TaxID=6233 RepID=A0A7E4VXW9_PANRE
MAEYDDDVDLATAMAAAAAVNHFSIIDVLTLSAVGLRTFWQMWLSILVWMAVSYVIVYLVACMVAVVMLRNHSLLFVWMPFVAMIFIGPTTYGAVTSASIAWTVAIANKSITAWHCMLIGCGQTLAIMMLSFVRILATL